MHTEGLFRKIRMRLTPPSSNSFKRVTESLLEQGGRNIALTESVSARLDETLAKISNLEQRLAVHDAHSKLRLEALYRRPGEDAETAKRRFFAAIPEATGSKRLMQLANAKLMAAFDELCTAHDIGYWFSYGTLIATLSRGGFIPWDDDIDLCMMRDDIKRLSDALADNKDFQLTLVYDWFSPCRQIRFCSRNANIPCFIDVSIYDWATDALKERDDAFRQLRLDLMDDIHARADELSYWKGRGWLAAPGSGGVAQSSAIDFGSQDERMAVEQAKRIEEIFSTYRMRAVQLGILCERDKACAVGYALDNTYDAPWRRTIWPKEMIWPLERHKYEHYSFLVPHEAEKVADECYPGWPYLPSDILGHDHFAGGVIDAAETQNELEAFLNS